MNALMVWGVLSCLLVIAELLSGSVYMLMLTFGAVVGAACAMFGFDIEMQVSAASAAAILGTAALYGYRKKRGVVEVGTSSLDVGSEVTVEAWDAAERARVQHRGAAWAARWVGDGVPSAGTHRVIGLQGNVLELTKA